MIKDLVRKNILNLKPYTSARDIYSNTENISEVILLDANENNYGTTAIKYKELNLNHYPDPHQNDLKGLVDKHFNIDKSNLFFGVGSDEIIDLLIRIFCEPKFDEAMILEPTYGMYQVSCDINDVRTHSVLLNYIFQIDFNEIEKYYNEKIKIIFLCSPNNPTGNLINKKDILELCKKYNSIIVVDEAYIDFAGEENSLINFVKEYPNLVVLRTFSKAWGLAGIRLGFCVADNEIISLLFKIKAPYNINTLTRDALKNAINNIHLKNEYVNSIIKGKNYLSSELLKMSIVEKIFPSDTNYLLVKFKNAKLVQQKLLKKNIIIRDRSSQPKLDNCLRISIGTKTQNEKLIKELKNLVIKQK